MAPTDERVHAASSAVALAHEKSTIYMPSYLIALAALLLLARVVDLGMSFNRPNPYAGTPVIRWAPLSADCVQPSKGTLNQPAPPAESPRTEAELKRLLADSHDSHKMLLLEFFANWSDPCRRMEGSALSNSQVTSVVDKNFHPVRVTDFQHESGTNTPVVNELLKKYRIFAFPTLVIVSDDGEAASTLVGSCSSLTTYRFLTRAISQQRMR